MSITREPGGTNVSSDSKGQIYGRQCCMVRSTSGPSSYNCFAARAIAALSGALLATGGSFRLRLSGHCTEEIDFLLLVWAPVRVEDFMEPDRRLAADVWFLPGVPRQERLRFPCDQAPIHHCHVVLLPDRQRTFESALVAAGHVFGAKDRPVVALQRLDALLEDIRGFVAVERNDVRH